jgi:hypothetical protein
MDLSVVAHFPIQASTYMMILAVPYKSRRAISSHNNQFRFVFISVAMHELPWKVVAPIITVTVGSHSGNRTSFFRLGVVFGESLLEDVVGIAATETTAITVRMSADASSDGVNAEDGVTG